MKKDFLLLVVIMFIALAIDSVFINKESKKHHLQQKKAIEHHTSIKKEIIQTKKIIKKNEHNEVEVEKKQVKKVEKKHIQKKPKERFSKTKAWIAKKRLEWADE